MDTITKIIAGPAAVLTTLFCIAGLLSIGLGLYWLFNKQARLRDLAELRKRLDELKPSDPEYGGCQGTLHVDGDRCGTLGLLSFWLWIGRRWRERCPQRR